jgi:threonine dehydrogenase-like Zn-dependent dehydrogenase
VWLGLSLFKTGIMSGPDAILGHEISAVVAEDRSGRFEPGAHVVPWPIRNCGECMWCAEGHPQYCTRSIDLHWGGFAERSTYRSTNLLSVPEGLDERTAALAEPLGVAVRGVWAAEVEPGALAFVSGLGSIGSLVVSVLADMDVRVIGADPREDRRKLGEHLGCEMVFDPVAEDPWRKTLAVDPHGPRYSFECSGVASAVQQAINVCGHMGTVALLGMPIEPATVFTPVIAVKEQRIVSISSPSPESMAEAMRLLLRRPRTADVITDVVGLDDAERAMTGLIHGTGGIKVLVAPSSE